MGRRGATIPCVQLWRSSRACPFVSRTVALSSLPAAKARMSAQVTSRIAHLEARSSDLARRIGVAIDNGLDAVIVRSLRQSRHENDVEIEELKRSSTLALDPAEAGLWLLIGLPGVGKSTFAAAAARCCGRYVVSIDQIRGEYRCMPGSHAWHSTAPDVLLAVAVDHIHSGVTVDSCGVDCSFRQALVDAAREAGRPCRAIILKTPESIAERRLQSRSQKPSEETSLRIAGKYRDSLLSIHREGFTSVHVLSDVEQAALMASWSRL